MERMRRSCANLRSDFLDVNFIHFCGRNTDSLVLSILTRTQVECRLDRYEQTTETSTAAPPGGQNTEKTRHLGRRLRPDFRPRLRRLRELRRALRRQRHRRRRLFVTDLER